MPVHLKDNQDTLYQRDQYAKGGRTKRRSARKSSAWRMMRLMWERFMGISIASSVHHVFSQQQVV